MDVPHSPDYMEETIQEIMRGRCAAAAVTDTHTEKLVVVVEVKKRGESHEEAADKLTVGKREVTSAMSNSYGVSVADLVLVPPDSTPITQAARSAERRVSSCTGTVSSPPLA